MRITGTRSAFQTGSFFAPNHVDYPVDPRQSTLYNWWTMQHLAIGNLAKLAKDIQTTCNRWEEELRKIRDTHPNDPG